MVENGPRPPQKHQEAGSLFIPMSTLFPSLQIGGEVIDGEEMLDLESVFETEIVDVTIPEPRETELPDEIWEILDFSEPVEDVELDPVEEVVLPDDV